MLCISEYDAETGTGVLSGLTPIEEEPLTENYAIGVKQMAVLERGDVICVCLMDGRNCICTLETATFMKRVLCEGDYYIPTEPCLHSVSSISGSLLSGS